MTMTQAAQKRLLVLVVVVTNLALWVIPSNVLKLIARDRHVLLGRYSKEHFTWIIVALIASIIALYVGLGSEARKKKRTFHVLAILLASLPTIVLLDIVSHPFSSADYVLDGLAYHRRPNQQKEETFEDRPVAQRSYPNTPQGFGRIHWTLTTDRRGYRNRSDDEQYDLVVLGDSFAEGSRVSDEQTWPARLAWQSGLSVYNLGMSGYDPQHYLAAFERYGRDLRPKIVACTLYEGNDFRSAKWIDNPDDYEPSLGRKFKYYLRLSPIFGATERFITDTFGRINKDGKLRGGEILSWLPVPLGAGPMPTYYAFSPKRMLRHFEPEEEFLQGKHWKTTVRILHEIKRTCDGVGAQLLIVYAPDKPHVVLPLVKDKLPAEKVHAFASLEKDELPDADRFVENLLARLPVMEKVTREFCRAESIAYVSATSALQAQVRRGRQIYYTYDQHWTPIGHEVVAEVVHTYVRGPMAAALDGSDAVTARRASANLNVPD